MALKKWVKLNYLQDAQVQFEPQLQSTQVQLGFAHFPFSDSEALRLNDIDNFIIYFLKLFNSTKIN